MIQSSNSALPAARHQSGTGAQPFERIGLWGWVGLYVTGALLLFFLFGHVLLVHLKPSVSLTAQATSLGLTSPFVRVLDLALLTFAVIHGLLGLRRLVLDCEILRARGRAWLTGAFSIAGVLLIVFGYVLLQRLITPAG